MKRQILLFLFTAVLSLGCFGQKVDKVEYDTLFRCVVETPASFPGGTDAFLRYFELQFQYPDSNAERDISGGVRCSCIITKGGVVTEIQIIKGLGFGIDEEVIRVLSKMPKWIPAQRNGRNISWRWTQDFIFCLGEDSVALTKKEVCLVGEEMIL
ncbi:MAG: TonB family protein [Chitinophagaceae bacterium]